MREILFRRSPSPELYSALHELTDTDRGVRRQRFSFVGANGRERGDARRYRPKKESES